jgi:tetratricopeptide (TPR) repeat protein
MRGDIKMNELEFEDAISSYLSTVKYQDAMMLEIKDREANAKELTSRIRDVKSSIIKERGRAFDRYNEYETLEEEMGKIELETREQKYQLEKLNIGKTRWNLAESFERLEKLEDAIKYYREAISFNYNSNAARKKIVKLQLKIKRGY